LKAAPFEYARAASLSEACALLATHGDGAKLLAGGQSLVPMMAMRLVRPAWLVDIDEIAELKFIAVEKDMARTGACTRQCVVERDHALAARVPLLRQALAWVGHVQTRNRGTIGGSLAHADPCAELPLVAQVLGARMLLRSGSGARTLEAGKFFAGPMATNVRPANVSRKSIGRHGPGDARGPLSPRFPCATATSRWLRPRPRSRSTATGAACARHSGWRSRRNAACVPGIAARLVGTRLDDAVVKDAANAAAAESKPGSDLHASAEYRRHLAGVLAARALQEARERARSAQ